MADVLYLTVIVEIFVIFHRLKWLSFFNLSYVNIKNLFLDVSKFLKNIVVCFLSDGYGIVQLYF